MMGLIYIYGVILLGDITLDWHTIVIENRAINHKKESLILTVSVILISVFHYFLVEGSSVKLLLSFAVMFPSVRWIIHDAGLNLARQLPINYLGEGENAAWTDRFLAKVKLSQIEAKIIALMVSIVIVFLINLKWL